MSTRDTRRSDVSAAEILDEAGAFLVGGGLITMVLFPLAVPIIALVVIPLIPIVLVAALAGAIVAAPVLLLRLARSLLSAVVPAAGATISSGGPASPLPRTSSGPRSS